MSMLHKLAQEVIQEESKVMLPAYKGTYIKHAAKLQVFEEVTLEEICKDETSRRIPDCIGKVLNKGIEIWVEIYCTNPIRDERHEDIQRRKQYCIEIDLSDLLGTDYTKDGVRERLLNESEDREWICHPEWDEEERQAEEKARKKQEAEDKAKEAMLRLMTLEQKKEEKHKTPELLLEPKHIAKTSSTHKSTHTRSVSSKQLKEGERDWVMYAKTIYGDIDAVNSLFRVLANEYTKVTLENSHQFVADEVYLRCNELLPRVNVVAETQKRYLVLLLSIWVLDRLNHSKSPTLGKIFVDNSAIRNEIFRAAKQIGSIDKHPIDDTIIPAGIENRDVILQILRTCYM
jgi:hypothetical protein